MVEEDCIVPKTKRDETRRNENENESNNFVFGIPDPHPMGCIGMVALAGRIDVAQLVFDISACPRT